MKKVNVNEASGPVLDWMVAKCEGGYDLQLRSTYGAKKAWQYTMLDEEEPERMDEFYLADVAYSTDWAQGGPIIEREGGTLWSRGASGWVCKTRYDSANDKEGPTAYGPTPLIAAMRCFVASRLGEEVEVPDELM